MTFGRDTADRTTYAVSADRTTEVVRYDRSGKWWREHSDGTRHPLAVGTAADEAIVIQAAGGFIRQGMPGGGRFYPIIAQRQAARRPGR